MSRPSPLVMLSTTLRQLVRWAPLAAVGASLWLLFRGGFAGLSGAGWREAACGLLLLGGLLACAGRRLRRPRSAAPMPLRDDLELGATLIAQAYVVVALGGPALYPIIYLLMAFLVSFMPRRAGFLLLGIALAFDAVVTLRGESPRPLALVAHGAFLVLFAALYHVILSARVYAARHAEAAAVKRRLQEVEERARTFRLISAGSEGRSPDVSDQEKWLLASVKEIEGAAGAVLEIAENALRSHTCAAFFLTPDDRELKLHECRSASEAVQRERFQAGEGVLGGVLKRAVPVRMCSASPLRGVTYYDGKAPAIHALLAVPILEHGTRLRGVLVADRTDAEPFSERDEELLASVAAELLRAIEVERVLGYIRKSRDEKERFFRAILELNRAQSPDEVFSAVLESTRQLAEVDFCAVTLVSETEGKRIHRIVRVTGVSAPGRALEGHSFEDNNSLCANVVRYGAPLPGRDIQAMDRQVIFAPEIQVRGLAALKIFPLIAGDRIVGTLVVGSRKKTVLDEGALRMIEVIAVQAAQAVLRAQLFEQMERMATTDGLTGLFNHRTFQGRADELLAQSRRYGRSCSLILTDIDHFKTVNDTYGHPIGDQVLKGVAKILRQKARDTDVVARYGGEEFAILMPETDTEGALIIAERIREAVASEVFQTELGPLKITLSLGVATCPTDVQEKQPLIDLADQCLYHAKRHGRNQVVSVARMRGGRKQLAASTH